MKSEDISIVISVAALLGSIYSVYISEKYNEIAITQLMHDFVIGKAKDCNELALIVSKMGILDYDQNDRSRFYPMISEIIISIQLLDNLLDEYKKKPHRYFFLLQFWIQLSTPLRSYIKTFKPDQFYSDISKGQMETIQSTFKNLFQKY